MRTAGFAFLAFVLACSSTPESPAPDADDAGALPDAAGSPDADAGAPPDATVAFTVGGTVSGLASGESVVLANGAATVTVSADGAFAFPEKLADGTPFDVRVALPPASQTCRVTAGAGAVKSADVTTIAVACRQRFAYLAGWRVDAQAVWTGDVVAYRATSAGSLALLAPPSTIDVGKQPSGIAVHPSGDHLYVSDAEGKAVHQLDLGSDGRLTPMATPSLPVTVTPSAVTVHPAGIAVYVAASFEVFQFSVGPSGALTPMTVPSVASAFVTRSIVVDAAGKHAYASNEGDGTISQYDVGSDGALTPMAPAAATVAAANDACAQLALHPSGLWAYAACRGATPSVGVEQLALGKDGKVTALGGVATTPTGNTLGVTVHPSGKWVYAVSTEHNMNPGRLSQFAVGPDGKLTPLGTPSVATGVEPSVVVVDARGENVFVVDSGLAFANGAVGADVRRYSVDLKTGALTYAETLATPSKRNPYAFSFSP